MVEAAARLPADCSRGAVTAWSALRWYGAAYFDGRGSHGEEELPVVLASGGHKLTPVTGVRVMQHSLAPGARVHVGGLPVTTVQRALFDEIRRLGDLWSAVQAIDMTTAAGLTSVWLFAGYLAEANSLPGVPLARQAAALAVDESRSPRESWLRLVWLLLAGLPQPLVNVPLFTIDGRFLAKPDLFDPVSGTVAEYAGLVHLDHHQRRADLEREADIRAHGLEYVEVVRGDTRSTACDRLLAARARAPFLAPADRCWSLVPPAWWPQQPTLDARLLAEGKVPALVAH